jgi:hypothetical protein
VRAAPHRGGRLRIGPTRKACIGDVLRDSAPLPRAKTFTASGRDDRVPYVVGSSPLTGDVLLRRPRAAAGVPVRRINAECGFEQALRARLANTGDVLCWSP